MALTYGFFNSLDGDRKYSAEEFASFLDGIIYDGVYEAVGNKFDVKAYNGMQITIDSGRAWFDHTYTLNTTKYMIELPESDTVYDRIDAVVLEVNKEDRRTYFKIVQGTPAASPVRPSLIKTTSVKQYALAYITVPRYATEVSNEDIEYVVGESETPLVSALALAGIPSGGTIGQILAKSSSESGAVGWYDYDKLPYDVWYLADGINESNVIAAYKFARAANESAALVNVNEGASYSLSKEDSSIVWANNYGFLLPAGKFLHNESVCNANPRSVVIKFSDGPDGSSTVCLHAGNSDPDTAANSIYYNQIYGTRQFDYRVIPHFGVYAGEVDPDHPNVTKKYNSTIDTGPGILGVTFNGASEPEMYFNGEKLSLKVTDDSYYLNEPITLNPKMTNLKLIGGDPGWYYSNLTWSLGSIKIQGACFYNVALDGNQHKQIYRQMNSALG